MTIAACSCFVTPTPLAGARELGMDARFGEVAVLTCPLCGQHWLRYFYENEAFTASGRWYLGAVPAEAAATVTPTTARALLESLEWHFRGGSFFSGSVDRASGRIV